MQQKRLLVGLNTALILAAVVILADGARAFSGEKVLLSFDGGNGAGPEGILIRDALGNLYGTTFGGGAFGYGTVFKLAPSAGGGWNESILYSFTGGSDGGSPWGGLAIDRSGNLYGTTYVGGTYQVGAVFELTPTLGGWDEFVLYSFTGEDDGGNPLGTVVLDPVGNLYGTTAGLGEGHCSGYTEVGIYKCGAVFELSPAPGGGWNETTLHTFSGAKDGGQPIAGLVRDGNGNLYGTTFDGGNTACTDGCGTVFRLSPTVNGGWEGAVLLSFKLGMDGAYSSAPLIIDAKGNLYGTTSARGILNTNCLNGCGTVFKLSPVFGNKWQATVLHIFTGGSDGGQPVAGLAFDGEGNLYGTTTSGGNNGCYEGCGVVFKLRPTATGWKEIVLHAFDGSTDGFNPRAGVILDEMGRVYGTTQGGGSGSPFGYGTVFEIVP